MKQLIVHFSLHQASRRHSEVVSPSAGDEWPMGRPHPHFLLFVESSSVIHIFIILFCLSKVLQLFVLKTSGGDDGCLLKGPGSKPELNQSL